MNPALGDAAVAGDPFMSNPLLRAITLLVFGLVLPSTTAAPPTTLTEPQLAARLDALFAARWKKDGIVPVPLTDDTSFIRRVFLDLAGRIPSILEVRDFLDDDRPDKRRIWVDLLLRGLRKGDQGDTYSDHFAAFWREQLLPNANPEQGAYLVYTFEGWLRKEMRDNVPYDRLVR